MPANRIAVAGSDRSPVAGALRIGAPDPNDNVLVTMVVRRRPSSATTEGIHEMNERMPHERRYLSREEYAETNGATRADLEQIEEFAHQHGLTVVEASAARRS